MTSRFCAAGLSSLLLLGSAGWSVCAQAQMAPEVTSAVTVAGAGLFDKVSGNDLSSGLALYYPFSSDQGGVTADASGNGKTGTVYNAKWRSGGPCGGYLYLDGDNDYVDVGTGVNFPSWTTYSISIWFLSDGHGDNSGYGQKLIDKTSLFHDAHLRMTQGATGYVTYNIHELSAGTGVGAFPSETIRGDNRWHHIVIVRDGVRAACWYDGKQEGVITNAMSVFSDAPLYLGYSASSDDLQRRFWSGFIDEVRIYNRVLSVSEIGQLFQPEQPVRTLTVVNSFGSGQPADGQHVYTNGVAVSAHVASQVVDRTGWTRYLCMGAEVSGNAFEQPDATHVAMTITNDATLTWSWRTQYRVALTYEGNGQVSAVPQWVFKGDSVVVTATPAPGWFLSGWEGATNDCVREGLTLKIPMTRPRALRAMFVQNIDTPFADFAAWPENRALRFRMRTGTWLHSTASGGLCCLSPDAGGNASFQIQAEGPGTVSFEWELSEADGTNAISCLVGTRTRVTQTTSTSETLSVALTAKDRTVTWTVQRGTGSPQAVGIIRNLRWTPLEKASAPAPGNNHAVARPLFAGLAWNGHAPQYAVFAGRTSSRMKQVGSGRFTEPFVPADLLAEYLSDPSNVQLVWRVDALATDSAGLEVVNPGPLWKLTVLAPASAGFADDQRVSAALTVGTPATFGPYGTVSPGTEGTLKARLVAGGLPPGMKFALAGTAVSVSGVPAHAGTYHAAYQFSLVTNGKTVTGCAFVFEFNVAALDRAAGTFNGYALHPSAGQGSASLSVTTQGRLTGALSLWGTAYTFKADAFEAAANGWSTLSVQAVSKTAAPLPLRLSICTNGLVNATFEDDPDASLLFFRDNWKDADAAALLPQAPCKGTLNLSTIEGEPERVLTVTVTPQGKTRCTGTLSNGGRFSAAGTLLQEWDPYAKRSFLLALVYGRTGTVNGVRRGIFGLVELNPDYLTPDTIQSLDEPIPCNEW